MDSFLNTTSTPSPVMTWQSLPPVPEQSHDCFFNPSYETSVLRSPLIPIKAQFMGEKVANLGQNATINSNLPAVSADPGFAERAARFSSFGNRSFNGGNNTEFQKQFEPNQNLGNLRLSRVSSTPSLRNNCSQTQMEIRKFGEIGLNRTEFASPNGSSVSEQIPIGEIEAKTPSDSGSRKRKSISRGKSQKVIDEQNNQDSKRCKISKGSENKKEEKNENRNNKQDEKAAEPPKDYIHVRARRGQATDSHSLAERVRREKISERMKFLQDLVPGCNKVTGKALMLDEIINYVQSLQQQVEFLSMKLASVDPVDFNIESLLSKDATTSAYPTESSFLFGQRKQEVHRHKTDFSNGPMTHCSLDTTMFRDFGLQLPCVDEFGPGFSQFLGSYEDDLHSIVQMGFGQNPSDKTGLHLHTFPSSSDTHTTTHMSIEL